MKQQIILDRNNPDDHKCKCEVGAMAIMDEKGIKWGQWKVDRINPKCPTHGKNK